MAVSRMTLFRKILILVIVASDNNTVISSTRILSHNSVLHDKKYLKSSVVNNNLIKIKNEIIKNQENKFSGNDLEEAEFDDDFVPKLKIPKEISNIDENCIYWSLHGECNKKPGYMLEYCIPACLSSQLERETDFENADGKLDDLLSWAKLPPHMLLKVCEDSYVGNTVKKEENSITECAYWAEKGECYRNSDFMLLNCSKSCEVCYEYGENIFEIGWPQRVTKIELLNQIINIMIDTHDYMMNVIMSPDMNHDSVRSSCVNNSPWCSAWAAEGKCEDGNVDFEWMTINCAPVCQSCHLLDKSIRCPTPSISAGDIDLIFKRLIGELKWSKEQIDKNVNNIFTRAVVYSRPVDINKMNTNQLDNGVEKKNDGPWLVAIDDFLSQKECERLIEMGYKNGFIRSTETSFREGQNDHRVTEYRKSNNAWCSSDECMNDPIVKHIMEKISIVTNVPVDNQEDLQLLRYEINEFYREHHDFISNLPRVLTFFMYLNEGMEGGETRFTTLRGENDHDFYLDIKPKRGMAVIWPSVMNGDPTRIDERTYHESLYVKKGKKYASNAWIHLRDIKNRHYFSCP